MTSTLTTLTSPGNATASTPSTPQPPRASTASTGQNSAVAASPLVPAAPGTETTSQLEPQRHAEGDEDPSGPVRVTKRPPHRERTRITAESTVARKQPPPQPPVTTPEKQWDRLSLSVAASPPTALSHARKQLNAPLPPETPPPERVAALIVIQAVEILQGHRPIGQLRHWLTPEVFGPLARRAGLAMRIKGPAPRTQAPRILHLLVSTPMPRAAEIAVVVHDGTKVRGAGIRLEYLRERWQAAALEIG
ncbi:Rv3235 family protein [Actinobaculum sp. 313]|uniref:Rv3235 family protein n=1 Tax=Actinobaculum sp. 313 TaxID=2495645 RepID=UPI000D529243|nr:Rv3235 family protein [Actinobaculum sp. 313]AWE42919.1 hypothetical protein DDD63_09420 [Actinobaculum sp. 313]